MLDQPGANLDNGLRHLLGNIDPFKRRGAHHAAQIRPQRADIADTHFRSKEMNVIGRQCDPLAGPPYRPRTARDHIIDRIDDALIKQAPDDLAGRRSHDAQIARQFRPAQRPTPDKPAQKVDFDLAATAGLPR